MPASSTPAPDAILQIRIQLLDVEPPVTRQMQVPARFTFDQLHRAIQAVMPWQSYHLHEFETPDGQRIGELDSEYVEVNPQRADAEVHLHEHLAQPGDEINYQYDFGDSWDHHLIVEAVLAPEPGVLYPRLLAGARAAPPEDSGGTPGYEDILENLRSEAPDPEMLGWLPRGFDPERFDLEAARRRLAREFRPKGGGFQVQPPATAATQAPAPDHNPWCERLGIPVPQVDALAQKKGMKLVNLMVGALLERGAPMTLDEVAARLAAAGVVPATGDLAFSLRRAWKGQSPIIEGGDGRLRLDLEAIRLRYMLWELSPSPAPLPAVAPPPPPADEVPLSEAELEAAFRGRYVHAVSSLRQAAAVLDVAGTPLAWAAVEARLAALTSHRHRLRPPDGQSWRKGLVVSRDGVLALDRGDPNLGPMRRAIRALAAPAQAQARQTEHIEALRAETMAQREASVRQAREAAAARRALLVVLPDAARPQALALLDLRERTVRTWTSGRLPEAAAALAGYDWIAAPHARTLLEALGLDPERWRLADLKPPQKTLRRDGRVLWLTPEMVLESTLGLDKALPSAEEVATALAGDDDRAIERLLLKELRAFHALLVYGMLQRSVLVRHGRNLETLPVEWALPGDPHLWSMLTEAQETGRNLEFVTGKLPSGLDLFTKPRRGTVVSKDRWTITLVEDGALVSIPRERIRAARLA